MVTVVFTAMLDRDCGCRQREVESVPC